MMEFSCEMNRRGFLLASYSVVAVVLSPGLRAADTPDPWSKKELMEPPELATLLKNQHALPVIYCVAFPVLYRGKHIPHAKFAGPASKAEGITDLRMAVASLPKVTAIVVYCGCCPMKNCPNIRPAYRTLKELGFDAVRVLDLPTNFHTDWVLKGYPVV